jgi:hypothetical protein
VRVSQFARAADADLVGNRTCAIGGRCGNSRDLWGLSRQVSSLKVSW